VNELQRTVCVCVCVCARARACACACVGKGLSGAVSLLRLPLTLSSHPRFS
jgi:hypothetical protein